MFRVIGEDPCTNMNNHQNTTFYQFDFFLNTPLDLLGVYLKKSQINKYCTEIFWANKNCYSANHPYLYKGLQ